MAKEAAVKYAVFAQVNGEWRHEGFVHSERPDEADRIISEMKKVCEEENGKGTFRTHAFLDQPHKAASTDEEQANTADVLLNEKMG